jgi:flagellar biogenesis protein FliO
MFRNGRCTGLTMTLAMLLASSLAMGQTTQPAGQFDHLPLRRDNPEAKRTDARGVTQSGGSTVSWLDLQRLGISLGIVLALVVGTGWVYRRLVGGASSAKPSSSVRLLSRTVLAPRQQVLLLQVGRRVIVVGDSGGHFTTLAEVTDAVEVSELVASSLGQREADEFSRVFSQRERELDAADRDAAEDVDTTRDEPTRNVVGNVEPIPPAIRSEIGSLIARVRALSGQMKQ